MDGTLVTLSGLNAVRKMSLQGQTKKVTGGQRQKNAQAASSVTPDTQSVVDTAPPSVYTPVGKFVWKPLINNMSVLSSPTHLC